MPTDRWPNGTFVTSTGLYQTVYYLGRDYTATVVKPSNDVRGSRGYVHHLLRNNSIFVPGSPGYRRVGGCRLWVDKYVPEGYRA